MKLPKGYFVGGDCGDSSTADEVIDERRERVIDTGLLDSDGNPIRRRRATVPFGFVARAPS